MRYFKGNEELYPGPPAIKKKEETLWNGRHCIQQLGPYNIFSITSWVGADVECGALLTLSFAIMPLYFTSGAFLRKMQSEHKAHVEVTLPEGHMFLTDPALTNTELL